MGKNLCVELKKERAKHNEKINKLIQAYEKGGKAMCNLSDTGGQLIGSLKVANGNDLESLIKNLDKVQELWTVPLDKLCFLRSFSNQEFLEIEEIKLEMGEINGLAAILKDMNENFSEAFALLDECIDDAKKLAGNAI